MKKTALAVLLLAVMLALSGCSTWTTLMDTLGISSGKYDDEEIVAWYDEDSEIALTLKDMVRWLIIDSLYLKEFTGAQEGYDIYRDAVLNKMLCDYYGRYNGNRELLEKAEAAYPGYLLTSLIPVSDFESEWYALFGGSWKITHTDGELFAYLEKADGYTCTTYPRISEDVTTECISLLETEHTYRYTFRNIFGDEQSPKYMAILIKRSDGTMYFRSLKEISDTY